MGEMKTWLRKHGAVVLAALALGGAGGAAVSQEASSPQTKTVAPTFPAPCSITLPPLSEKSPDFEQACGPLPPPTRFGFYANGRLPNSVLAPIYAGRLWKPAAAAWNNMNAASVRIYHVRLVPLGSLSSYRDFAGQEYLYRTCSRPGWCAVPGRSNHGLGKAVDLQTHYMRFIVDQIGWRYGWAKRCSDAGWEWWHVVWNNVCTGTKFDWKDIGPLGNGGGKRGPPTLSRTRHPGRYVLKFKRNLRRLGYQHFSIDRSWGPGIQAAVRRFQRNHHLKADGIVGSQTWRLVLKYAKKR